MNWTWFVLGLPLGWLLARWLTRRSRCRTHVLDARAYVALRRALQARRTADPKER